MSGVRSLSDVNKNKKKDKKDDDKTEEFSQVGATSGTSVLRPVRDEMQDVVSNARAQGGKPVAQTICNITLYRNGFIVGDGEFRSLDDPANRQFIAALKEGNVPDELAEMAHQQFPEVTDVGVNLINKISEDYVPAFRAFQSTGFSLGSSVSSGGTFADASAAELKEDSSAGSIRVVTHSGDKFNVKVSNTTTVLQLYQHVMFLSGHPGPFDLLGGFPPKPLMDPSQTCKDAGLIGSAVRQKI